MRITCNKCKNIFRRDVNNENVKTEDNDYLSFENKCPCCGNVVVEKVKDSTIITKMYSKNHVSNPIPLFDGKPKRELVINPDDLLNLKIALGTSKTVEELITQI
jgi:hypothetical protein